jgi:hypothetical protein
LTEPGDWRCSSKNALIEAMANSPFRCRPRKDERLLAGDYSSESGAVASVEAAIDRAATMAERMPKATAALADELRATVRLAFADDSATARLVDHSVPPLLIRGWKEYNIVSHRGQFSAIPLAAGPLDLSERDPHTIPGAIVRNSYESQRRALSTAVAS